MANDHLWQMVSAFWPLKQLKEQHVLLAGALEEERHTTRLKLITFSILTQSLLRRFQDVGICTQHWHTSGDIPLPC